MQVWEKTHGAGRNMKRCNVEALLTIVWGVCQPFYRSGPEGWGIVEKMRVETEDWGKDTH